MNLPKIDYSKDNIAESVAELLNSVEDKGGEVMGSGVINPVLGAPSQTNQEWITDRIIRGKNPSVDLRRQYGRVFRICTYIALAFHIAVAVVFPKFEPGTTKIRAAQQMISMEDIPETRQIKRPPPPPRPAVPIETESADVPDDVTIETTDLDFDNITFDLPPPPPPSGDDSEAEEIVEFWAVEKTPVLIKGIAPEYPDMASKAELEGVVFVEFLVGKDGRVYNARVLKGPPIFQEAALEAVRQFVFKPAIQNDEAVTVRMTQPIRFRLTDRR